MLSHARSTRAAGSADRNAVRLGDGTALIRDSSIQRVYYFDGRATTGSCQPRLVLRGGASREFGNAMALEGCMALISSSVSSDRNAPLPGLIHVFNRCATGEWVWKASFGAPG